ncbi:hypothetical protein PENTCL1PPCAC_3725, partial [Pristionchus entomophagus]
LLFSASINEISVPFILRKALVTQNVFMHRNQVSWYRNHKLWYRTTQFQATQSDNSAPMDDGSSYEDYYASSPSTSHREPEWVTFATPICIGVAILICFAKIMCRNCSSQRNSEQRNDSIGSDNSQHWFQRSHQQFAQNSGIPPMIDAFFPAPPKYEDVMRAKEEESLEGGSTPPRYSIQSSLSSTVISEDSASPSPSEHDAPPDYSTMARPTATRTRRMITVATTSIDDPEEIVVVVHSSGRDNHAYAGGES